MTQTVVRRDVASIPHRDAGATWKAIVDLLGAGGGDAAKRRELMSVAGVICSAIADQAMRDSPIVVTCDGPRTRIYCCYDDDTLDDSDRNEGPLGFDALKGEWQLSVPVAKEDLTWVQAALKVKSTRVIARDKDQGIDVGEQAKTMASNALVLDVEGFMKT
jgi:hypothetical protein